jgi:hypothetical protein
MLFVLSSLASAGEICTSWSAPSGEDAIVIEDAPTPEASGVAGSSTDPSRFYTHNDAGGEAKLYVFDTTDDDGDGYGAYVGEQLVTNATNTDWEDVANGPCPSNVDADRCLWIADTGDNEGTRDTVSVWVVPESFDAAVDAVECRLAYPGGKHRDAEGLFVDPDGGIHLVSKETGEAHIYTLASPTCDGSTETLQEEAHISIDWPVTGAAMNADGTEVVLRTDHGAWAWSGCTIDWTDDPTPVDLGSQPQGEGVTFTANNALVTTSEGDPLRAWELPCEATEDVKPCSTCGCGDGNAAFLLLPLALLRRRRQQ